jgi:cytochrome c-type biogenesis protein CcmE
MKNHRWLVAPVLALAVTISTTLPGQASDLRYHYVPVDAAGNTKVAPVAQPGGGASPGERVRFIGLIHEPAVSQPRPTHLVTFKHSYTGRNITVPLTLQPGTPRMAINHESVSYNYGSEKVEVQFLKDGSVDVVYSTGLLRRI